jgi:arylsulfatase A-like enzyme/Flp pilus assembly protein TadD
MKTWQSFSTIFTSLAVFLILCTSCGQEQSSKPNVLLVTFDTTRADRIGCYGYEKAETPVFDQAAAEGVLFENAYCQVPITLPSHASILTGLYPPSHSVRLNGPYLLPENIPTLAEVMKNNGYATSAFISAYVMDSQFGLDRGFDVYDDEMLKTGELKNPERRAGETVDRAIEWLGGNKKPFLMWVHFFDPHRPFEPPEPYKSKFSTDLYDGEIAYTDAMLGRLTDELEKKNLSENTLVILTADHGEGLGEHDEEAHSLFLYDTTIRVPLVVKWPEGMAVPQRWKRGARLEEPVETVDIMPTVLSLVGIGKKPAFDGLDLTGPPEMDRMAYAETLYPHSFGWSPLLSIRREGWKLIHAPQPEFYNIPDDPPELNNLYASEKSRAEDYKKRLLVFYENQQEQAATTQSLSSEQMEALESLGYLGTTAVSGGPEEWVILPDPKNRVDLFDRINEARDLTHGGRHEQALELVEPYLENESNNPILLNIAGLANIRRGRLGPGMKYLEEYRALAPDDPEASFHLGVARIMAASPAGAVRPLEEAVALMPAYAAAWDQLGIAWGMQGQLEKALEAGQKAVDLEPHNPEYLKNLGVTLLSQRKVEDAARLFQQAVDIQPDNPDYRFNLGNTLLFQEEYSRALEHLEIASERQPDNPDIRVRYITALLYLGKIDEGQAQAEKYLEQHQSAAISYLLGQIHSRQEEWNQAAEAFEQVIALEPTRQEAWQELASVYLQSGVNEAKAARLLGRIRQAEIQLPEEMIAGLAELSGRSNRWQE